MTKPYKGTIMGSRKDVDLSRYDETFPKNLGYVVTGYWQGHPDFGYSSGWTSLIVKKSRWKNNQCEIETLNSRYTWIRDG